MKNVGLITILLIYLMGFPFFITQISSQTEPIFSIRIVDFQSPVRLGEFLEFTYFTRSVSGVNGTAELNFWIEKDGKVITSGSDTIFLGGSEEKTRTASIFLPSNVKSGIYDLKIEANYGGSMVSAYRTIELNVKGGIATVNGNWWGFNIYIILALILLASLNIYIIYHIEKKKIKRALLEEGQFIKRHKFSFLTASFFLILGVLVYYLSLANFLPEIPLYFYYIILGVLLLMTLFLGRNKKRNK